MPVLNQSWFVVLPDHEVGERAERAVEADWAPTQRISHPTGRPWIVGSWPTGTVQHLSSRDIDVVIVGACPPLAPSLLDRFETLAALDTFAAKNPGQYFLLARSDRMVRSQGNIGSTCRLFYTELAGHAICSDRPAVLAEIETASIDVVSVALRLLTPTLAYPLDERPLWEGVKHLAPGSALVDGPDRDPTVLQWWSPPSPDVSLRKAAPEISDALGDAVARRMHGAVNISVDLSGGLDSTTLTFLAAAHLRHGPQHIAGSNLTTIHWVESDPANDDAIFAQSAADALSSCHHQLIPQDQMPAWFAEMTDQPNDPDEPYRWARARSRIAHTARTLAATGSQLHLAGHGGDELFMTFPSYLHGLVRRRPLLAMRRLRAHRALSRWPLGSTMRQLRDTNGFGRWLHDAGRRLRASLPPENDPQLGWGPPIRLCPWATTEAENLVRTALHEYSQSSEPLAAEHAQSEALQYLRSGGAIAAQIARVNANEGLATALPYFDHDVVETALSVRLEDRMSPFVFKPLLAQAMASRVPADLLGRTTKGDFSVDMFEGIRLHRSMIDEVFAESRLAALGLIDPEHLRTTLRSSAPDIRGFIPIEASLSLELWLRAVEKA